MAKAKKIRAANVAVPQSREEAASFLRQIGDAHRAVSRIEADLGDRVARLQEIVNLKADIERLRIGALTEGLRIWCEANRDRLTDGGKTKTADLGTGKVSWRQRPAKVSVKGIEKIIAKFKELGMTKFIRVKEELDKEAMLKDKADALLAPGVTIGSDGEDFAVEPFNIDLAGNVTTGEAA